MIKFNSSWDSILAPLFTNEKYLKIREFLKQEYSTRRIFPEMQNIYNCFKHTKYEDIKCVILGQDPYHEEGQAQGLSQAFPYRWEEVQREPYQLQPFQHR